VLHILEIDEEIFTIMVFPGLHTFIILLYFSNEGREFEQLPTLDHMAHS